MNPRLPPCERVGGKRHANPYLRWSCPTVRDEVTKGNGSSWIFEPCLTWANVLQRVQQPAFSLVSPKQRRTRNERLPLPRAYPLGGTRAARAQNVARFGRQQAAKRRGSHGGEPAITNRDAGTNRAQIPAHSRTRPDLVGQTTRPLTFISAGQRPCCRGGGW